MRHLLQRTLLTATLLSGIYTAGAEERDFAACWRAADEAEALAARYPPQSAARLEAEHLIRQGRGEGGSGEYDECFEYLDKALELLKHASAEIDKPGSTSL